MAEIFSSGRDQVITNALKSLIGDETNTIIRASETIDFFEADALAVLRMAYKKHPELDVIKHFVESKMLFRQPLKRQHTDAVIRLLEAISREDDTSTTDKGLKSRIAKVFGRG